jgi:hypothetical protein
MLQLDAVCLAYMACVGIAAKLQVDRNAALRIGQAGRIVFWFGQRALAARLADARRQLGGWTTNNYGDLLGHVEQHIKASESLHDVLAIADVEEQPATQLVFAAAMAPPHALLAWLSTVADVLLLSGATHPDGAQAGCQCRFLVCGCAALIRSAPANPHLRNGCWHPPNRSPSFCGRAAVVQVVTQWQYR